MKNLISVIMPYYKKKEFVETAINSVLEQSNQHFEIIIIYDDENLKDLKYINEIQKFDDRIRLIKNDVNMGAGLSRNKGIFHSNGDYIAFLDCDDYWHKNKLSKQLNFMTEKNCLFSFTSYDIVNYQNKIIRSNKAPAIITFNDLLKDCKIGLSTVMLKKELIKNDCKFPKLKTKEDYTLWLKISKKINLYGLDEPLMKWRKVKNSLSSDTFQKIFDGYRVYHKYLNLGLFKSFYYLMILSINYLKKN